MIEVFCILKENALYQVYLHLAKWIWEKKDFQDLQMYFAINISSCRGNILALVQT